MLHIRIGDIDWYADVVLIIGEANAVKQFKILMSRIINNMA